MAEGDLTAMRPQLILFSTDSAFIAGLSSFSERLPFISYETGNGPEVTAKAQLDALWATLMVGVELFGAVPPFPLHEASVHKTPLAQVRRGFPKYAIVGVAVSKDDPKTPDYSLRLTLKVLLAAVKRFNSQSTDKISRVGILADDLGLRQLQPTAAFAIIREAYQEQQRKGDSLREKGTA